MEAGAAMFPYGDYAILVGAAMTAAGAAGPVDGMKDGGGWEVWPRPAREGSRRNMRIKRTKRTKSVGKGLMERIRSTAGGGCRVCAGIEGVSAEENAAVAAGRGGGMGREGNGHDI
jgi:hypothetical protein